MTRPATVHELNEKAKEAADATPLLVSHDSLAAALVAALAELTVVEKARKVTVAHKGGGQHSYDYADIADVVKLTRPVLARHGLVALTPVHGFEGALACTVTLLHTSGERLDLGPFPFPHGHDAQATGSMVTYHRRYALVAALGIAAGDDDDGASARARQAPEPEFVWDMKAVQFELRNLCKGNKDDARAAWEYGNGDALTAWSKDTAQQLYDAWLERPMTDQPEEPALPLDGET